MVAGNLIQSLRILLKNIKSHFITVSGMSIAFTAAFFLFIYINNQIGFDKRHANYETIYRLEVSNWALHPSGIAPVLADKYPEIQSWARIGGTFWTNTFEYKKNYHLVKDVIFADGTPFDLFTFDFLSGDPADALVRPDAIVLTESLARRIFGEADPIGQVLTYNNEYKLTVTAIIKDIEQFHIPFQAMINFYMLKDIASDGNESFLSIMKGPQNYLVYFDMPSLDNPADFAGKITRFFISENIYTEENHPEYSLRPFKDIYFMNENVMETEVIHGNRQTVMALSFVALFILLISIINYVNISTSEGLTRSREVALKKISGSGRASLVIQFIAESALLGLVSLFIALVLVVNLYQIFQDAAGISLPSIGSLSGPLALYSAGIFIFVALGGGLYPALSLSSGKPSDIFNSDLKTSRKGLFIRRSLITIQFTIAIFLTVLSILISTQFMYMTGRGLGFNCDRIINFELPSELRSQSLTISNALLGSPAIEAVSFLDEIPGNIGNTVTLRPPLADGPVPINLQLVNPEYIDVMGIEVLAGHFFSRDRQAEKENCLVINETMSRSIGYPTANEAIGNTLRIWGGRDVMITGVVKDYHFNSLHQPIKPTMMMWYENMKNAHILFKPGSEEAAIGHMEKVWKDFVAGQPFHYSFLEESFNDLYNTEKRLGRLVFIFTVIAMLISCFGIYGMSSFMSRQMSKSISLRKVMGGKTGSLVRRFSSEYLILSCLAALLALPLSYIYGSSWLERFPYKTSFTWWILIAALLINLLVALATTAWHAYRTATSNPAEVLREQ